MRERIRVRERRRERDREAEAEKDGETDNRQSGKQTEPCILAAHTSHQPLYRKPRTRTDRLTTQMYPGLK